MKNRLLALLLATVLSVTGIVTCSSVLESNAASQELQVMSFAEPSQEIYDFVGRMYVNFLGREAEPEGREGWAKKLADKEIDGAAFAYGFAHSPEFEGIYNNVSSEELITRFYRTFLGREPEPEGLSSWAAHADNWAPLDWLVGGFVNSQEFTNICSASGIERGNYTMPEFNGTGIDGRKIGDFVERFYTQALGRESEPAGKRHWATKIATGEIIPAELVYGFMESQEFANRSAAMTNGEYVTCMYHTFFNREPDEGGYNGWVNDLDSGARARHDIIDGFVGSQEYFNMVDSFFNTPDDTPDDEPDIPYIDDAFQAALDEAFFVEWPAEQEKRMHDKGVTDYRVDMPYVWICRLDHEFFDAVNAERASFGPDSPWFEFYRQGDPNRLDTLPLEPFKWLSVEEPLAKRRCIELFFGEELTHQSDACPTLDSLSEAIGRAMGNGGEAIVASYRTSCAHYLGLMSSVEPYAVTASCEVWNYETRERQGCLYNTTLIGGDEHWWEMYVDGFTNPYTGRHFDPIGVYVDPEFF